MDRLGEERREREGERLRAQCFYWKKEKKKKKKKVMWCVRIGWRKTYVLRKLLT